MCMKFLRFPIKTLDGSYTVQEKPLGAEGTQSLLRRPSLITALFVAENLNGVVRGGAAGGNVAGVTAVEGALFEELNHLLRILDGQQSQDKFIDEREDGGIGPDAERQRQNGRDGKHRGLTKLADDIAGVLQQSSMNGNPRRSRSSSFIWLIPPNGRWAA